MSTRALRQLFDTPKTVFVRVTADGFLTDGRGFRWHRCGLVHITVYSNTRFHAAQMAPPPTTTSPS